MASMLTHIMLGLMLFFSTITLLPRGFLHLRGERPGKGILYVSLGLLSAFFGVLAFHYAYTSFVLLETDFF